jgi:hypothetical protein
VSSDYLYALDTTGGRIKEGGVSATAPTFIPSGGDLNTGIGWAGADILSLIAGGTNVMNITNSNVGIGTTSPTISDGVGLHLAGKILRIGTAKTPATAGAAGNAGEICWDADYLYVCIATNTWRRIAHATW